MIVQLTTGELERLVERAVESAIAKLAIAPATGANEPPPEWLDAAGAAALLKCSRRYVTILAGRGELPSSRLGRLLRFRRVDVVAVLERRRAA
jgi:excisionase family DNA binding protein